MKKKVFSLVLAATILLAGCFGSDVEPVNEKLDGTLAADTAEKYEDATHILSADKEIVTLLVAGEGVSLDGFLGQKVEVEGGVVPAESNENLKLMTVTTITPLTIETAKKENWIDTSFNFQTKFPAIFIPQKTTRGVAFFNTDNQKIFEVSVLENSERIPLIDFLQKNYGYTADQLNKVDLNGVSGFQFQNQTGAVVYLDGGAKIYTLVWYDSDAENREENRRAFLEMLQDFQLKNQIEQPTEPADETPASPSQPAEIAKAGAGEFCGGIAAIECVDNFVCQLEGAYPDAGGTCVAAGATTSVPTAATSEATPASTTVPAITAAELNRGWYFGDADAKKSGTPPTWILVSSGTENAMWQRPDGLPAETTPTLAEPDTTADRLTDDRKKVLEFLTGNINSLAPEKSDWQLVQAAFVDPNFVYATFSDGEKTRKLLFVYSVVGSEVELEKQAYMRPGETKDWVITEGVDTAFGKAQTVVNPSGVITDEILEDYRELKNERLGYKLQYPKDWYWQNAGTTKTEFAERPFPAAVARITIDVLGGGDQNFGEVVVDGDAAIGYAKVGEQKVLKIIGSADDRGIVEVMTQTAVALPAEPLPNSRSGV